MVTLNVILILMVDMGHMMDFYGLVDQNHADEMLSGMLASYQTCLGVTAKAFSNGTPVSRS